MLPVVVFKLKFAIVISEETGKISIAINGMLNYNLSLDDARMILIEELKPYMESTNKDKSKLLTDLN